MGRARTLTAVAGVAVALATVAAAVAAPARADEPLRIVALGDSAAAGPLIPLQTDAACLRSDRNWPSVTARTLGARLTDVTCSGAKTTDLAGRQFGTVAPQYDALTADTDVVTLEIGANDIDLGFHVPSCIRPAPGPPAGCSAALTAGGRDRLAERIDALAPAYGAALEEIHRRAPDADVLVLGYLTYWQPGGCYPADPIHSADADYLQATFDRLMTMIAGQAGEHDATYVDIRTPSSAHGLCAPPAERWLEGLVPVQPAAPYHPNATGMRRTAATVSEAIEAPTT